MSINPQHCQRTAQGGWTIPETLVSITITLVLMVAVVSMAMTSGRAFLALYNYGDLNAVNKVAMDTLTRDVRECNRVTACSATVLSLEDSNLDPITYTYNSSAKTFTRTTPSDSKVLLTQCSTLSISIFKRTAPVSFGDPLDTATPANAKVVNVSWNCSRTILGAAVNTESVQTARIVIRKQG